VTLVKHNFTDFWHPHYVCREMMGNIMPHHVTVSIQIKIEIGASIVRIFVIKYCKFYFYCK